MKVSKKERIFTKIVEEVSPSFITLTEAEAAKPYHTAYDEKGHVQSEWFAFHKDNQTVLVLADHLTKEVFVKKFAW